MPSEVADNLYPVRYVFCWIVMIYYLIMTFIVYPTAIMFVYFFTFPIHMLLERRIKLEFSHHLARCLNFHFMSLSYFAGVNVTEYGEDMSKFVDERCLVLPNHLGLIDHFIVMRACDQHGTSLVGRWMFVIYNIWKYIPLGLLWSLHGNYFVSTVPASQRVRQLNDLRKHFDAIYYPNDYRWVCLYPEGSRLYLIKKSNREFERKNQLEPLKHCAYPRLGAALSVLQQIGPKNGQGPPLKYLVDVTLGYEKGEVLGVQQSFMKTMIDGDRRMYSVHYQVFEIREKWKNEEDLKKFLFDRYQKKDELLDDFYKSGKFPGPSKLVEFPPIYLMVLQQICGWAVFIIFVKILSAILFTVI